MRPYMIIIKKFSKIDDKDCIVEEAHFEEKIKDDHLLSAHVIIDILNGEVLKSREDLPKEKILEEYNKKYSDKIIEAVRTFFIKHPQEWEKFTKEARKIAEELDNKQ